METELGHQIVSCKWLEQLSDDSSSGMLLTWGMFTPLTLERVSLELLCRDCELSRVQQASLNVHSSLIKEILLGQIG